ncbi:MAG: DNA repair protein RadA [Schleiferiaceae bacterium]|jgi:DNA repair protein RadA/Sms|nr:DNA repair protein RadA [Flavobacteriales bacterium]MDO7566079.1 DNA repair protein RadA [Schleiferiaceae bacterium]MBT3572343.1 DNA repair protein RadA [Flavobacteriales bacterium]MBT3677433.1 DNA repair protein RadA [Flavobacteriales bacterium]MBT3739227.1 DNA repair protein RadA [Flavobacteriales bacterium]
MAKVKKAWFCQQCGSEHSQWMGQCKGCGEWNSLVEEILTKPDPSSATSVWSATESPVIKLAHVDRIAEQRLASGDSELDRVLGGGFVAGSLTLLGGEPGIGKSTLLLQVAIHHGDKVLYASGEESAQQIRMRAERIGLEGDGCHVLTEMSTAKILSVAEALKPTLIIIDSIQTAHNPQLDSSPGSVSQIRESASEYLRYAKSKQIPILLIGHITKEGSLAGPKVLEHMVDVVLQFEGDRHHLFRTLRAMKNRFGSTQELGVYEMTAKGMQTVSNPSRLMLGQRGDGLSGSAVGIIAEGNRPMLVEVQALVSSAVYGTPQRSCTGFDTRRLNMLLAVLEKRCGFQLGSKDVFLNVTGGLKVEDPALDLAVCAAILSSNADIAIPEGMAFTAEVGLGGELRPVPRMQQRLSEAVQLGFDTVFCASQSESDNLNIKGVKPIKITRMDQLVSGVFG